MPYVTACRASAPHRPSCLGSPSSVMPRLPTARRASAPHHPSCLAPHGPSCLGSPRPVVPRSPSPVMCNGLASRRPVIRPMPRPNMACSRRRQPRFTNIFSFALPWRSHDARSAARLRRGVGPLSTPKAVAGRTGSSNITGNNRPSSGHFRAFPGISGHRPGIVRASSDTKGSSRPVSSVAGHTVPYGPSRAQGAGAGSRAVGRVACARSRCRIACGRACRVRKEPVPDRVRYSRSRAKGAGAGSRAVKSVAGERSRCRIACRKVGRVRKEPSPGTASGMVVMCGIARCRIACGIARRPITSRHIPAHLGDLTSLRWSRSGAPNARRLPCPGPTAPVADAANLCLRTYILLHCRGAS